ncbi:protein phosphatase 2C domain-containing protein [Isoptericola sp. b515]|uniref:PP2C family protein-serine/threonine phosphatase n=1 Tax=Isoptericola sp. b515 TaxID=3064652 RepID=UPI0027136A14|nr:PP2C family serine/threonine-protein phosphatase [Isoptericola sp. b515]MDO8147636.1 protein phosphatase 2C domain-containing protein [Isoptericola sp. b515]
MTLALRYAARSDVGLVRHDNQDSAYAGPNLLVVADGMGGHAGGDIASSLAISALAPLDTPEHGPDQALQDLEETVERARQDLVHASEISPELAGMGTTVTALLRSGNTLAMAHLGDSRAYLLRDDKLTQVTVDHTFVQHLVDTGRISPDEAETHPQRNVVMRVLGDFDVDLTPDMSIREARAGDRWLLCSDGLSGFVPVDQITEVLARCESPDEAADMLITLAMTAGSTDNITVVVADLVDDETTPAAAPTETTQVVGAAATDVAAPVSRDTGTEPATTESAPTDPTDDADDEDDGTDDVRPKRRPWVGVLVLLLVLAGVGLGGWWAYGWTQDQYYLGVADGQVAVYQGIPQDAGPLTLSRAVEVTDTSVDDLPAYWVERLDGSIRTGSLDEALERADRLAEEAAPTPVPSPSPSPSSPPSPSGSPRPDSSPSEEPAQAAEEGDA